MSHSLILPSPEDSPEAFRYIKHAANDYWQGTQIQREIYGYQVQPGAKWRVGLTEAALAEFQHEMGYVSGHSYAYRPIYYSYLPCETAETITPAGTPDTGVTYGYTSGNRHHPYRG